MSRARILTAKLLACLCIIAATNVVYNLVTVPLVLSFADSGALKTLALLNASLLFLQLIFFAAGFAVSAAAKKIKSVLPYSLGLVFMSFALSAFAVTSKEDKLRYLTPFQYFSAEHIMANGSYETRFAVLAAVLVCLGIAAAYLFFIKKQIRSR
ncbi:MAG: ABC-2 family transporter protein [Firmicutes bacterium ADurb.Bin262]|nr:MAG: ABC-2 family transporter protein [Firmicutes bacterium ADurb.Bin262]